MSLSDSKLYSIFFAFIQDYNEPPAINFELSRLRSRVEALEEELEIERGRGKLGENAIVVLNPTKDDQEIFRDIRVIGIEFGTNVAALKIQSMNQIDLAICRLGFLVNFMSRFAVSFSN